MSLFGTPMDFKTIYNLEYTKKEGSVIPYHPEGDSNPVSAPWHRYLVPDESLKHLIPADGAFEDPECVRHRAYIREKPNLALVRELYRQEGRSLYQFDFCRLGDFESKKTRARRIVPLPPGWHTPLSTQRCSYRDPKSVLTVPPPLGIQKAQDNLVPVLAEREVLKVRTGESDYMDGIGAMGDFILREKLYGEVRPRGLSPWEVKRRLALLDQGVQGVSEGGCPT